MGSEADPLAALLDNLPMVPCEDCPHSSCISQRRTIAALRLAMEQRDDLYLVASYDEWRGFRNYDNAAIERVLGGEDG